MAKKDNKIKKTHNPYKHLELKSTNSKHHFYDTLETFCKQGIFEEVALLLKDPLLKISPKCILLAAKYGHTEVLGLLLRDSRVDPSVNDNAALIYASANSFENTKLLLDAVDQDGNKRLAYISDDAMKTAFSCSERRETTNLLISDKRFSQNLCKILFEQSCLKNCSLILYWLLEQRSEVSYNYQKGLDLACSGWSPLSIEILLNANVSLDYNSSLRKACKNGFIEIIEMMMVKVPGLFRSLDMDVINDAMYYAVECDRVKLMKELLQQERIDASIDDDLLIITACTNGHLEMVEMLVDRKEVDPAARNNLCLRIACKLGHFDIVKFLLGLPQNRRIDPNVKSYSPLRKALKYSHLDIANFLLKYLNGF